eukprot:scaffold14159_cov115-Isochrysis_galbana.AAC.4
MASNSCRGTSTSSEAYLPMRPRPRRPQTIASTSHPVHTLQTLDSRSSLTAKRTTYFQAHKAFPSAQI